MSNLYKPDSVEIKLRRARSGLSQKKAAELVGSNIRTWQDWEYDISGMHPGLWELFNLKTRRFIEGKIKAE